MPAPTPITYPCGSDTIGLAAFATYAQSTQAALAAVAATQATLLRPPAVFAKRTAATQAIAAGAPTAATFEAEGYDTDNMWVVGSPGQFTVRSAGSFLVNYGMTISGLSTTLTSVRVAILVNGVEFAYEKSDEGAGAFVVDNETWISAFLPSLVVGDIITFTILFTGTGNLQVTGTAMATRTSIV